MHQSTQFVSKEKTGLWLIDVQENLFPLIDRRNEMLERICFVLEAAQALHLPIFVSEQYPDGLGGTLNKAKKSLPQGQVIYPKTAFSGYKDPVIKKAVDKTGVELWLLIGIEAHICVLQTAKDLLADGKRVVVLSDAVSSRSPFDFAAAMEEMRALGIRVSTSETVLYEIVRDAKAPEFKAILPLVKSHA